VRAAPPPAVSRARRLSKGGDGDGAGASARGVEEEEELPSSAWCECWRRPSVPSDDAMPGNPSQAPSMQTTIDRQGAAPATVVQEQLHAVGTDNPITGGSVDVKGRCN
jgi:hypothetical protein